jgi:copper homeostasis protein
MAAPRLEICVESLAGLEAALAGGADRIELCQALDLGGLTPSAGLMRAAAARSTVPVVALIRPRPGGFRHGGAEQDLICADIAAAADAGLAGVVVGALAGDALDRAALERFARAAEGLCCSLHRAVDLCADPLAAVDVAADLGFRRVLTSGGAATAAAGRGRIAAMVARAGGRLSIMAGAGVTARTAGALRDLGLRDIHASCARAGAAMPFGFGAARVTDAAAVAALKAALLTWG